MSENEYKKALKILNKKYKKQVKRYGKITHFKVMDDRLLYFKFKNGKVFMALINIERI